MTDHLIDTNVFSEIFKGNDQVKKFVEGLDCSIDVTVYVECIQGSKSSIEKRKIKKYLTRFPLFYHNAQISEQTIALIDAYSNSHGLMLPDAQIAAVCLVRDLTLVTYNVSDFKFIKGLKLRKPGI
jgi:predicted nucleic acid-binding protein